MITLFFKILFTAIKLLVKVAAIVLFFAVLVIGLLYLFPEGKKEKTVFGTSFSKIQAEDLGLNPDEVFLSLLDDLKIKNFRLASYWTEVEPKKDEFYWDTLDFQINEIKKREGKAVLVLGRKQFRWPECHIPEWAVNIPIEEQRMRVLNFIEKTVFRYKDEKTIWAWQVENEPLFPFGNCPERNKEFLDEEIKKVKELDSARPIIITDSGEFSFWINAGKRADIFGTTLYRIVKNRVIPGYLSYEFVPTSFYRKKAAFIKWLFPNLKDIIIIELQAEPWGKLKTDSLEKQFETVNFERFKRNIKYAEDIGYKETYLWGAEWWYFMKAHKDHPEFWDYVKELNF